MPRFTSKKIKKGGSLDNDSFHYQPDPQATKINKINETVLVKEINKVIKKTKSRPIDTLNLLK